MCLAGSGGVIPGLRTHCAHYLACIWRHSPSFTGAGRGNAELYQERRLRQSEAYSLCGGRYDAETVKFGSLSELESVVRCASGSRSAARRPGHSPMADRSQGLHKMAS